MKIQDICKANQSALRITYLKQRCDNVEKDNFSVIIANVYQDNKMLAAVKESLINELSRRISAEETYLMELGFEISED